MADPRISVVTVFFNRAPLVAETLASLLAQTHPDYEIIVVDDGSTDGTWDAISQFHDAKLHCIRQENQGFTAAIDAAVRTARGSFIAIHGSGDISLPNRLERQAKALAESGAGVASCLVRTSRGVYRPPGWDGEGLQPLLATVLKQNPFSHGEVMFRKELFLAVGGYRRFFTFSQDRDLWLRMGERADYVVVPEILYERRDPPGSVRLSPDKTILQKRLSAVAVKSAMSRLAGQGDPVETAFSSALTAPSGDLALAATLGRLALSALRRGRFVHAWQFVQAACREIAARLPARTYAAVSI